jgi:hypothetical protein
MGTLREVRGAVTRGRDEPARCADTRRGRCAEKERSADQGARDAASTWRGMLVSRKTRPVKCPVEGCQTGHPPLRFRGQAGTLVDGDDTAAWDEQRERRSRSTCWGAGNRRGCVAVEVGGSTGLERVECARGSLPNVRAAASSSSVIRSVSISADDKVPPSKTNTIVSSPRPWGGNPVDAEKGANVDGEAEFFA